MTQEQHSPAKLLAAAAYGAVLAIVIAYLCSYVLMRSGLGVISSLGESTRGPAVFSRAALNLYAIQHSPLVGEGAVTDALGTRERVKARITLPLTVWAAIPAIALLIGGAVAAGKSRGGGRRQVVRAGLLVGLIYGVILMAAAGLVSARIGGFVMPEIGGVSPNPPEIPFRAESSPVLLGFGVLFAWLGALIVLRNERDDAGPSRWWACGKAVVVCALVLQLVVAGVLLERTTNRRADDGGEKPRIVEMLPTAAGLGYAMLNGTTLVASVESRLMSGPVQRPFLERVNLYGDSDRIAIALGALLLGLVLVFVAGALAVRWGSRDGPIRTGLRVAVLNVVYVLALILLCEMRLAQSTAISSTTIQIRALLGPGLAVSFVVALVTSSLGAALGSRRASRVVGDGA